MNKKVGILAGFLFSVLLAAVLVSAAPASLSQLAQDFVSGIINIVKPILGANDTADIFMAKLVSALIVFSIVYAVLSRALANVFSGARWAVWVVSIAVAILGVRFLSAEMVQTIILPNSAFAVALTAGIPFVIYFLVVSQLDSSIVRRIAWIFFAVIFLGLYTLRYQELGGIAYIYPLTALLSLIMLFLDGTIRRLMDKISFEKTLSTQGMLQANKIDEEIKLATQARVDAIKAGNSVEAIKQQKLIEQLKDAREVLRGT